MFLYGLYWIVCSIILILLQLPFNKEMHLATVPFISAFKKALIYYYCYN